MTDEFSFEELERVHLIKIIEKALEKTDITTAHDVIHRVDYTLNLMEARNDISRGKLLKIRQAALKGESSLDAQLRAAWAVIDAVDEFQEIYRGAHSILSAQAPMENPAEIVLAPKIKPEMYDREKKVNGKIWTHPILYLGFGSNIVEEAARPRKVDKTVKHQFVFEYPILGYPILSIPEFKGGDFYRCQDTHLYRYIGQNLEIVRVHPLKNLLEDLVKDVFDSSFAIEKCSFASENPDMADYRLIFESSALVDVKLRRDGVIFVPHHEYKKQPVHRGNEIYKFIESKFGLTMQYFSPNKTNALVKVEPVKKDPLLDKI